MATMVAIPPDPIEEQIDRFPMRVLRPVIRFVVRRRAAPVPPVAGPAGGCVFPELVTALEGSPAAHALREAMELAWGSPGLSARSRALILAVVGKALDCPVAASHARVLLEPHGFTGADVDQILANLASPKLDPFEARLVPFARETVRYRPEAIQRRVRDFSAGLSREELLETIGMTSLANALGRLSILLS
jgi:alkylhydroperoxidase family enzyme